MSPLRKVEREGQVWMAMELTEFLGFMVKPGLHYPQNTKPVFVEHIGSTRGPSTPVLSEWRRQEILHSAVRPRGSICGDMAGNCLDSELSIPLQAAKWPGRLTWDSGHEGGTFRESPGELKASPSVLLPFSPR